MEQKDNKINKNINDNAKDNINENNDSNNTKKDSPPFSEKLEDTLDTVVGGTQDLIYGPQNDFTKDIPATMELPSGLRKINKVQTRRNFNKRFIFNKKFLKIVLSIFGIGILFTLITIFLTFFMK